jgi:hypothetical protein
VSDTRRAARRAELRRDVKLMRALGVARWGAIYLGPPPGAAHAPARPLTAEEMKKRALEEAQRRHDTLFAATSVKPRLRSREEEEQDARAGQLERTIGHRVPREVIAPEARGGPPTDQPTG